MTVQQKLVSNKWFKLGVCVFLTLAVVVVFVLAPFATARAIVGVDDAVIVILIAALAGCGITFASTGAFNTLEEYVGELLGEYATDNNTTVFSLTNGLQSNSNKLGQILLNNRWMVLIQGFASWLKLKFSLANNSNYTLVEPGIDLAGYTIYGLPFNVSYNTGVALSFVATGVGSVYVLPYTSRAARVRFMCVSESAFVVTSTRYRNGVLDGTTDYSAIEYNGIYYVSNVFSPYPNDRQYNDGNNPPVNFVDVANETIAETTILDNISNNYNVDESAVGININTETITLPVDKPGFQVGDGGVLDVGADWTTPYPNVLDGIPQTWPNVVADDTVITLTPELEADIVEQVPAQTDIENLPGGSSFGLPVGFGNLRLADIWHYVHQWVVDTSVAGGLLWNTANAMASPVVNMVFAMVVIAIVFGTLKHLRSH